MNINSVEDAKAALAAWGQLPGPARQREIRQAIEKLELNCLYYEQKENQAGQARAATCIGILQKALAELA